MKSNTAMKIFLVDDEPVCLHLFAQILNNLGYTHLQYFSNCGECLDQLSLRPDLIFLDDNMGDWNGVDMMKKIRRFDPDITVVFISGQEEAGVAASALKFGAFDYIVRENIDESGVRACLAKVGQAREQQLRKAGQGRATKLLCWLLGRKTHDHGDNHVQFFQIGRLQ